jgi:hypothetical protein
LLAFITRERSERSNGALIFVNGGSIGFIGSGINSDRYALAAVGRAGKVPR